jgi:hypothetical protein
VQEEWMHYQQGRDRRVHALLLLEEEFGDIKQYKHFLQAKFAGSNFLVSLYYLLFDKSF